MTKLTKNEKFILKMEAKFPNKFDYTKTDYTIAKVKTTVTCKEHKEDFLCHPQVALTRTPYYGCSKCKNQYGVAGGRLSVESVKKEFAKVHGDTYDYSLFTEYRTTHGKINIICKEHGVFKQTAKEHKAGRGCAKCAGLHSYTPEEFKVKASEVHNNKYTYLTPYTKAHDYIEILCPEHGIFKQKAYMHLIGQGCRKCSDANAKGATPLPIETVIKQFNKVHFGKYDYSKMVYKTSKDKVVITCPKHGDFEQNPANHKKGYGCPSCSTYGFNTQAPAILYYLSINNGEAYKVGITNRTIKDRFTASDLLKIDIVQTWVYNVGEDARKEEQRILKEFAYAKYKGDDLLDSGNTELFTHDVLCKHTKESSDFI